MATPFGLGGRNREETTVTYYSKQDRLSSQVPSELSSEGRICRSGQRLSEGTLMSESAVPMAQAPSSGSHPASSCSFACTLRIVG